MPIETEKRLIDANLNRLREGIRVVEDIARYILNDLALASTLKTLRHKARIDDSALDATLLQHRDIKNDILKTSTPSEKTRENLRDIVLANFKRSEESARVLEEIFKLDFASCAEGVESALDSMNQIKSVESSAICEIFKAIRYELYDIEIAYFEALEKMDRVE